MRVPVISADNIPYQVSVSDASWKRLGQCTAKKVRLVQRTRD